MPRAAPVCALWRGCRAALTGAAARRAAAVLASVVVACTAPTSRSVPVTPAVSQPPSPASAAPQNWSVAHVELPADVESGTSTTSNICSPCHGSLTSLTGVTPGGPGLVAVGFEQPSNTGAVWTSTDGDAWSRLEGFPAAAGSTVAAVTSGDRLVAVGADGNGAFAWTSRDGTAWTPSDPSPDLVGVPSLTGMNAVVQWQGRYVAGGYADPAYGQHVAAVWTSADGVEWSRLADGAQWEQARIFDLVARPTGLIAVGAVGEGDLDRATAGVWLSPDGVEWERVESPAFANGSMRSVLAAGPGIVAAGVRATTDGAAVWTSADGRRWAPAPSAPVFESYGRTVQILALAPRGREILAAGWRADAGNGSATVWSSLDGLDWQRMPDEPSFSGGAIARLVPFGDRLIAVGWTGAPDNVSAAAWVSPP